MQATVPERLEQVDAWALLVVGTAGLALSGPFGAGFVFAGARGACLGTCGGLFGLSLGCLTAGVRCRATAATGGLFLPVGPCGDCLQLVVVYAGVAAGLTAPRRACPTLCVLVSVGVDIKFLHLLFL